MRILTMLILECSLRLQINLVVGDYFKSDDELLDYTDQATELITWLRSKSLVLAILRDAQVALDKPVLAVIRAVLTRWTAHYQAYRRLLDLKSTLNRIVLDEEDRPANQKKIVTGDAKAKKKSLAMISIIRDEEFWEAILRYANRNL